MNLSKNIKVVGIVIVAVFVLSAACSPEISIVHRDHTHKTVHVVLDKTEKARLDYGDEVSFNVSRGEHVIQATPDDKSVCPWTENGDR